jgi:hypothetical protein
MANYDLQRGRDAIGGDAGVGKLRPCIIELVSLRVETRGGRQEVRKGEGERGVPRTVVETSGVAGIGGYLWRIGRSSVRNFFALEAPRVEK